MEKTWGAHQGSWSHSETVTGSELAARNSFSASQTQVEKHWTQPTICEFYFIVFSPEFLNFLMPYATAAPTNRDAPPSMGAPGSPSRGGGPAMASSGKRAKRKVKRMLVVRTFAFIFGTEGNKGVLIICGRAFYACVSSGRKNNSYRRMIINRLQK